MVSCVADVCPLPVRDDAEDQPRRHQREASVPLPGIEASRTAPRRTTPDQDQRYRNPDEYDHADRDGSDR
jgi:hypothetical protein